MLNTKQHGLNSQVGLERLTEPSLIILFKIRDILCKWVGDLGIGLLIIFVLLYAEDVKDEVDEIASRQGLKGERLDLGEVFLVFLLDEFLVVGEVVFEFVEILLFSHYYLYMELNGSIWANWIGDQKGNGIPLPMEGHRKWECHLTRPTRKRVASLIISVEASDSLLMKFRIFTGSWFSCSQIHKSKQEWPFNLSLAYSRDHLLKAGTEGVEIKISREFSWVLLVFY